MAKPKVMLTPVNPPLKGTDATVIMQIAGVKTATRLELEIHEAAFAHENDKGTDKAIGTLNGVAMGISLKNRNFTVALDEKGGVEGGIPQPDEKDKSKRVIAVVIPKGGGSTQYNYFFFEIPNEPREELQRRNWFLYVKMIQPEETFSNRIPMTLNAHACIVGEEATYDWHAHNQMQFFADGHDAAGADDQAFTQVVNAIKEAKHFIFITDWSFQPYFRMTREESDTKGTIGHYLLERANSSDKVLVGILVWRHIHAFGSGALDEHSNMGDERLRTLNGNKKLPDNFLWRATHNTTTYSHHQKFVVLDAPCPDDPKGRRIIKAFFGGLDLTKGRYDWHEHVIDPQGKGAPFDDFKKKTKVPTPGGDVLEYDDWYSAEFQSDSTSNQELPRQPWHDIYASVTGPSAWDIVREWVGRWHDTTANTKGDLAGSLVVSGYDQEGAPQYDWVPTKKTQLVQDLYAKKLRDKTKFIQQNEPPPTFDSKDTRFRWTAQVLRSMKSNYWATNKVQGFEADFKWPLKSSFERSIQDAYVKAIRLAEEYIYIETQYFISSGNRWDTTTWGVKNDLANEICDKIVERKGKGKAFHAYIIMPMWPEGGPGAFPLPAQRFFEWQTMQFMIARLDKEVGDWKKYVSFYFPGKNGAPRSKTGKLLHHSYRIFNNLDGTKTTAELNEAVIYSSNTKVTIGKRDRAELVKKNNRYMIYVHSKLMIVDDMYMILGSANLNERSLAGDRDTEICVHIWPKFPGYVAKCKEELGKFRKHLFKEHFGDDSGDPKSWGKDAQKIALENYWKYRRGQLITKGHCMTWPFTFKWESHLIGADTPLLRVEEDTSLAEGTNELLPDAPETSDTWRWWSTKDFNVSMHDLAE